jgi:hypothetical protein
MPCTRKISREGGREGGREKDGKNVVVKTFTGASLLLGGRKTLWEKNHL